MVFRKLLVLATIFCGFSIQAATTLEFVTPNGTVGPDDVVEVWLRLSTDTGFNFDPNDPDGDNSYGGAVDPLDFPTGGFSPDANMGAGAFVEFDFVDFVGASISASCSGSFVIDSGGNCGLGGAGTDDYNFTFGPGWAPGGGGLTLAAGESIDFLWGTFTPVAGGAAPGTYDYTSAGIGIFINGFGFDDFGEEVEISTFLQIDVTCSSGDPGCGFSRTVAPVPVPAAVWLFASALLGLTSLSRRKYA